MSWSSASPEDFAGVEALLKDILRGPLSTEDLAARRATLLTGNRGRLYCVGYQMIATLARTKGLQWVVDHLGAPWELLTAYQRLTPEGSPRFSAELIAQFAQWEARGICPGWLSPAD